MKKRLLTLLTLPLCLTLTLSVFAAEDGFAISPRGSAPLLMDGVTEELTGGTLTVFHSKYFKSQHTITFYVRLNTDCEAVWDYVQNTLEEGYSLVTLCPDRLTTSIRSDNKWFIIQGSSVEDGGEIQTERTNDITFGIFDYGGFTASRFGGDVENGFFGEAAFLAEFTAPVGYEETIYTSGTVRYKYTVTADGLTPITRYLTLPTTELATILTVCPS